MVARAMVPVLGARVANGRSGVSEVADFNWGVARRVDIELPTYVYRDAWPDVVAGRLVRLGDSPS